MNQSFNFFIQYIQLVFTSAVYIHLSVSPSDSISHAFYFQGNVYMVPLHIAANWQNKRKKEFAYSATA